MYSDGVKLGLPPGEGHTPPLNYAEWYWTNLY